MMVSTCFSSNQSILREINPEYSLEGPMLKLKLQYFGLLMQFIGKDPNARKDWGQENRAAENEMVREHHWLNEHEFEQTPGDGEGQGSLLCYSPVRGVMNRSNTTERLDNNNNGYHRRIIQGLTLNSFFLGSQKQTSVVLWLIYFLTVLKCVCVCVCVWAEGFSGPSSQWCEWAHCRYAHSCAIHPPFKPF